MTDLGRRLASAIGASGKSRQQIAAEAETTVQTISKIIRGHHENLKTDLLLRIARAVGTTAAYLLGGASDLAPEDVEELRRHRDWIDGKLPKIDAREEPNAVIVLEPVKARRQMVAEGAPVEIPERFREDGARIVARAIGDSLSGAGILPGDLLYVVPETDPLSAAGKLVLYRLGGAFYVKRLVIEHARTSLVSESIRYAPIEVAEQENAAVVGIVIGRSGAVD